MAAAGLRMETVPGAAAAGSAPAGDNRAMAPPSPASRTHAFDPTVRYDVAVVGGGLQGLATAYTLARDFGSLRIVLLEADRIGGTAPAWDDAIFLGAQPGSVAASASGVAAPLYDRALSLWDGLSGRLRTAVPVYPRVAMAVAHDRASLTALQTRVVALKSAGLSAEWRDRDAVLDSAPWIAREPIADLPILGAAVTRRAGIASRRTLVAAYRRAAERLGVTLIDRCPVAAIATDEGRAIGVETPHGQIRAAKVALAVGAATGTLTETAGLRLPLSVRRVTTLQSDPVAPTLDALIASDAVGAVVGQSEDGAVTVRGSVEAAGTGEPGGIGTEASAGRMAALVALMPRLSRLAVRYRRDRWVALFPDAIPAIAATPVAGLFLSAGWGTAAAPALGECFARLIATGAPAEEAAPFALDRFGVAIGRTPGSVAATAPAPVGAKGGQG